MPKDKLAEYDKWDDGSFDRKGFGLPHQNPPSEDMPSKPSKPSKPKGRAKKA